MATVLIASVALSGCQFLQTPLSAQIAVQSASGEFRAAVCKDMLASHIKMSERISDANWTAFWEVDSSVEVSAGDILSPSAPPESGIPRGVEPAASVGTSILVYLNDQSGDAADTITATFTVPSGGLPSSQWLHPDGSQTDEPCDGSSAS
jgi:hypothetical protein